MTHAYHEGLPDYVEGAIFQDGCEECERRAANFRIDHMDPSTWARTRLRALLLETSGLTQSSRCEIPVLRVIGQVLMKEAQEQPVLTEAEWRAQNPRPDVVHLGAYRAGQAAANEADLGL